MGGVMMTKSRDRVTLLPLSEGGGLTRIWDLGYPKMK